MLGIAGAGPFAPCDRGVLLNLVYGFLADPAPFVLMSKVPQSEKSLGPEVFILEK